MRNEGGLRVSQGLGGSIKAPGASSFDAASSSRAVKSILPTHWAFRENSKTIKACALCVKRVVTISSRQTLLQATEKSFVLNS